MSRYFFVDERFLGGVLKTVLVKLRSLRTRLATFGWSVFYNAYLHAHPGVDLLGWVTVSGRMIWKIDPRGCMIIHPGVRIHSGPRVNGYGGHRPTIIWVLAAGRLTVGPGAGVSSSTIVCQDAVTIGANVMIGGGSEIVDTDFHPLDPGARARHVGDAVRTAPVIVEEGAWIGGRVMVLKGVTIGRQSIIGAGSVVTRSTSAGQMWAGNPARLIRSNPPA